MHKAAVVKGNFWPRLQDPIWCVIIKVTL